MRIAVIVASTKRADILALTLQSICEQSRLADEVVLSVTGPNDLPAELPSQVTAVIAGIGLTKQRNAGVDSLSAKPDFVAFLDDDIILHRDYLRNMERLFIERTAVVLAMGHLLVNGNISAEKAQALVANCADPEDKYFAVQASFGGVYGCNMCIRYDVVERERFDERLSLYSMMEDVDIGSRVRRYGEVGYYFGSVAVHLRAPSGRVSHRGLGYSEVMNPFYLARKGSIPMRYALASFVFKMPARNAVLSIIPGLRRAEHQRRLLGNLQAIGDIALGRVAPERVIVVAT